MDGVAWMELVDSGALELPAYTLLCVSSYSKASKEKVVYFDDFAIALAYYGRMAKQEVIRDIYLTAYRIKLPSKVSQLDLLNRSNYALEGVTILHWENK